MIAAMAEIIRYMCMTIIPRWSVALFASVLASLLPTANGAERGVASASGGTPQLRHQGTATQLVVDGKPFLILGGELHNSSSSSLEYLQPAWDRLAAQHLNTVLAGVSWELIEPEEGRFDFQLVDGLVRDARAHQMKLVLLWFGSWKNGTSSYPPVWMKRDTQKFPRVRLQNGETPEVLTPLSLAAADADARAFAALLKHVREIDSRDHTVLMVQVENEVGVLGDSRDRSALADADFARPVPAELMSLFVQHKETLAPELRKVWEENGAKTSGSWAEVFGPTKPKEFVLTYDLPEEQRKTEWRKLHWPADEIFMAWHYSRYVNRVAEAGKREYNIPMYANAWLQQPGCAFPGTYPSGGPLPQVIDVWRVGAPAIDILAPDLYVPEFSELCERFAHLGNPLFIPETNRGPDLGRNLFVAMGAFNAIAFSPFGIDAPEFPRPAPPDSSPFSQSPSADLGKNYEIIAQIAPLVLAYQGTDRMTGFMLDKDHPSFITKLGGNVLEISLDEIFGHAAEKGYGIVMAVGPNEFVGAGAGFRVIFKPAGAGAPNVGVGTVDEGVYKDGKWVKGRRLNGDEDDQGRAWRFSSWGLQIEHCTTYQYQ
jgi:beta-galactosidase GanA